MILRNLAILAIGWMLVACGGGTGASSPPLTAPSALGYGTAPAFIVNQAITPLTPTVTGSVSGYSISPTLPSGLALSPTTGVLSGTPTTPSAPAVYTVTASNSAGSTTTTLTIVVNASALAAAIYPSSAYSFTAGVTSSSIVPSVSSGTAADWSVAPSLPAGLELSAVNGTISGTAAAAAPAATYAISTRNSSVADNLKISVSPGPVIDFGIGSAVAALRMDATRVLAQDTGGRWALWDYSSGNRIALGSQPCFGDLCTQVYPIDYAAPIFAIGTPTGLEVRSSATGALLGTIATSATWWKLASDGSYVCGGSPTGITVWTPSGSTIATKGGDYSTASVVATPGTIFVAVGPAGPNVIESISASTGGATLSASFAGKFAAWFSDNSAFLAADSSTNALRVYSPSGIKRDERALPAYSALGGVGPWWWTFGGDSLAVYQIGNSATATATYNLNFPVAYGSTIAAWVYGGTAISIIDLSGATPTRADAPTATLAYVRAYAASSASRWVIGSYPGAVLDGPSAASKPRFFGYGAPISVSGGTQHYAVATASGTILYFNTDSNALEGQIDVGSSDIQMSADGTVLAAQAITYNAQFSPDRTVNVYSLPQGTLINSFPSTYASPPYIAQIALSSSGTVLGEVDSNGQAQEVLIASGAKQWSSPTSYGGSLLLSPDGSGIAIATRALDSAGFGQSASTDLYVKGAFIATLPGIAAGWIDADHLLVNSFNFDKEPSFTGSQVYGTKGIVTGPGPIPFLASLQVVMPAATPVDLVYTPANQILSLSTSKIMWASGSPVTLAGAVTGGETVFISGSRLLAEPH